ncbi:MAG TPA: hypothetical protein DCY59_07795 [Micrococcaceae bacterium]|nr:hypothetical protein [Micrococcaceae bacterium]
MSVTYKVIPFIFLFLSSFSVSCARIADVDPVPSVAKGKGDCADMACFNDKPHITASQNLCPDGEIAVANGQNSSAKLVVCDCKCTSHDNIGWVAWEDDKSGSLSVVSVFPGKLASARDFSSTPSPVIHDIYAPVGMCRPVDYNELVQSDFVTLMKRPDEGGLRPYCFDALYMTVSDNSLIMSFDGHLVDADDASFFGAKVSARDLSDVQRVLEAHIK